MRSFAAGLGVNAALVACICTLQIAQRVAPQKNSTRLNAVLLAPDRPPSPPPRKLVVRKSLTPLPRRPQRIELPAPVLPAALPAIRPSRALPDVAPRPAVVQDLPAPPPRVETGVFTSVETAAVAAKAAAVRPQVQVLDKAVALPARPLPRSGIETGAFTNVSAARAASVPGAATSAGFGSASVAVATARGAAVQPTAFDTAQAGTRLPRGRTAAEPLARSVEILEKPRPDYTEEARRRRLEGEVWLEVLFSATGRVEVRRVLRPLGYGLDEKAMQAARLIRFKPATQGSVPVDEIATVRVQFQLAE